jgi:hypothetical protein
MVTHPKSNIPPLAPPSSGVGTQPPTLGVGSEASPIGSDFCCEDSTNDNSLWDGLVTRGAMTRTAGYTP